MMMMMIVMMMNIVVFKARKLESTTPLERLSVGIQRKAPLSMPLIIAMAMLVSQTSPVGVELLSYANAFFCSNKFA